jgi:hypothetical protein
MVCVYALARAGRDATRAAGHRGGRGMAGERLRWIAAGRVAAVVGEMPRRPAATIARARRYDRVVRSIARDAPALLPARFGTFFASLDELDRTLRARQRPLLRALTAVRGRVQMIVRVPGASTEGGAAAQSRDREAAGPAPASSGAEYLRARAAAAARARHVAGFEPLRAAVRRWIRNEAVEKRGRVASVYHLIPRAAAPAYERAIRRAAGEAGLRVLVTGPMPAYAFADILPASGGPLRIE